MKRGLFVGLNDYPKFPLSGCIADATTMRNLLLRNEDNSPNFATPRLLTSAPEVTRPELLRAITELFAQPADLALLYFSGHGYLDDNLGGFLVTSDVAEYSLGVSMSDVLTLANNSPVQEAVVILDCCHSGAFGHAPTITSGTVHLKEGRSVLTASRASEVAMEVGGQGIFTRHLLAALSGGAGDILGKVTVPGVYAYIDEVFDTWQQRPLFKANVSRLRPLRTCFPQIALDVLRLLTTYFPTTDYVFQLDPSYEPSADPSNPDHEETFARLQKFRATRLVEPIGEEHMYYAAMNSKSCRLTKTGQYYWNLASLGKI